MTNYDFLSETNKLGLRVSTFLNNRSPRYLSSWIISLYSCYSSASINNKLFFR